MNALNPQPERPRDDERAAVLAQLVRDDLEPAARAKLLGQLAPSERRGWRRFVVGPRAAGQWAVKAVTDLAPYVPIRDLETLRRHHPTLTGEALADRLVRNATRTTAAIGAAGGGLAAVEWVAPPLLLSAPALIAAETVAVVAVEAKLIAELHEIYGRPVPGVGTDRATALLMAWARRRGVTLAQAGRSLASVLGAGARNELRDRILRRMGRNLTSLGPFLTGAAVAGVLNRRATRTLAEGVRADLRGER